MTEEHKDLPAPLAKPTRNDTSTRSTKGILCPKCSHVNKPGTTKCARCQSHLHIKCNDCGATNERVLTRCKECGRRLHRSMMEKMNNKFFRQGAKVAPWQVVLAIIVVACLLVAVHLLNQLEITGPAATR